MIIGDRRSIKDSFNFSLVNPVVVVQAAAINITAWNIDSKPHSTFYTRNQAVVLFVVRWFWCSRRDRSLKTSALLKSSRHRRSDGRSRSVVPCPDLLRRQKVDVKSIEVAVSLLVGPVFSQLAKVRLYPTVTADKDWSHGPCWETFWFLLVQFLVLNLGFHVFLAWNLNVKMWGEKTECTSCLKGMITDMEIRPCCREKKGKDASKRRRFKGT